MNCIIVGNGAVKDPKWLKRFVDLRAPDLILAADGGFNHLNKAGVTPHILIGDMDSVISPPGKGPFEIVTFPREKNYTDLELAVELAIEKGARRILLVGATGNRMDHSLANILLLRKLCRTDVEIEIHDEQHVYFLVEGKRTLLDREGMLLSLLPLDPAVTGITLRGFKYPLEGETLAMGDTRGVSNIILSSPCFISAEKGLLLGILTNPDS